jgi:hypothetical protein
MSIGQPQHMLLCQFGDLVQDAFGTYNVYHVGSSMAGEKTVSWRDVDVRVLLSPEQWKALGLLEPANYFLDQKWRALCIVFSQYGRHVTGLPIDFQLQRLPDANEEFKGKGRSWMGTANAPTEDREHIATQNCWCDPKQDDEEPTVWIHNDKILHPKS